MIYDEQKRDEIEQIHTVRQNELITMRQTNLLKMPSADDYRAMYSIRVKSGLKLFKHIKHDDTAKAIDLPIYPLVFIDMSKWCDLTVNSAIIHYSDVLKNIDGEFTDENKIDYDWRPKAKNPSFEIDSIDDCKEYNVKVFGYELDDIKDVIRHCGTNIHIYRVAKMMMKLKGKDAKLDELLIEGTIAMYPEWISEEKLNENEEYCKKIAKGFVIEYLKKGLLDTRFQAFETLKFNEIVKDRMAKIPKFKNHIIQFIEEMKDEEMKQELKNVMKKYEYDI